MKRTLLVAIPAGLAFLAFSGVASANPRQPCYYGYGCGGFCLNLFGKLHQHGPLFNYGPYYGYPPFEPYGPWNAYLQYNPFGGHGCFSGCHNGGLFGDKHGHGGDGCGNDKGGLFHNRHGKGCDPGCAPVCPPPDCKAACFDPATTNPLSRYAGAGNPIQSAGFYAGLPTLDPALTPVGGHAK